MTDLGDGAFADNELESVTLPNNLTSIGNGVFRNNNLRNINIPNSVEIIGESAFADNELGSVTLPENLTSIGEEAFESNQLTSIIIPDSVTFIGDSAFVENKLTTVTIPGSVTDIGEAVFRENALTQVIIHNGVRSIGSSAFQDNQLEDIFIPESVEEIGNYAFSYNQLTSVEIPNSVTNIKTGVFSRNQLTSVTLPDSVTGIGELAFYSNQLTSVTLPDSVTSIGDYAFMLNQLTSVTIPDSVTNIGDFAFYLNQLTSITIPDSVTYIGSYAFEGNQLTSVKIPASVTNIGDSAFADNRLNEVTVRNPNVVFGANVFSGNQEPSNELTIKGYAGSTAETYANDNDHTFERLSSPTYTIKLTDITPGSGNMELTDQIGINFGVVEAGYSPIPSRTVSVKNTGTGAISNLAVVVSGGGADSYEIEGPSVTSLANTDEETTFTVRPKDNLPVATHSATITVTADNDVSNSFNINLAVVPPSGGSPNTVTVTFNSNGGSGIAQQTVLQGEVVSQPENPTRAGYTFAGWYSDEALTQTWDFTTAVTTNLSLYAKWTANNDGGSGGEGNNSGGSGSETPSPAKETITVDVAAGDKGTIAQTEVERTTNTDGTKSDRVTLNSTKATEAIEKTKAAGAAAVRLIIPDTKDEVKDIRVDLASTALQEVASSGLDLEIYTDNGMITIPNQSLVGLDANLYFHVIPIKDENEQKQVEERAKQEEVVRDILADGTIKVIDRPVTIETNMSSRQVSLTLPMDRSNLPVDPQEREQFLANLVIFIEHSDGDRVLVRPEIEDYPNGKIGLTFTIEKFSIFTIVNMENWAEHLAEQGANAHQAYMNGYPDGTFKPANALTRAEMATLLSRVVESSALNDELAYSDISANHWAEQEIEQASKTGLMNGYLDGTFQPNRAITRGEMAAIVARWRELTGISQHHFTDVEGHWAETLIAQVEQAGYMNGYPDGRFQPNKELTRAEAVAIINRILQRGPLHGVSNPTWKDVSSNHWAFGDIEEASNDHTYIIDNLGFEILFNK